MVNKFKNIKAIVYDFDGVMTDNKVLVLSDGSEGVFCNRSDGLAVGLIRKLGIEQCIISTEANPVVRKRADKLRIPCMQDIADKKQAIAQYAKKQGISLKQIAYIGNDINDLEAMKLAGVKIAPADAAKEILMIADIKTKAKGGEGVIYEMYKKCFYQK